MSRVMSRKRYVLGEIERVQQVGEGSNVGGRRVVKMKIEIAGYNKFRRGGNKIFKK